VKSTELQNQVIRAEKGQVVGPPSGDNGNEPTFTDVWKIECTDRVTGDVVWFVMNEDLRDEIVRQLTGGIVLAGGKLPKIP
jgi:hypothetical protein